METDEVLNCLKCGEDKAELIAFKRGHKRFGIKVRCANCLKARNLLPESYELMEENMAKVMVL